LGGDLRMTIFEYLAVAYTLVLSLAVVRLLGGIAHALRPGRRYWPHFSWLLFATALCLTAFWAFLSYRELDWTLPRFILILAGPALIYVFSSLVVPSDPSAVESWRDHFFAVRVPLFATGILFFSVAACTNYALLGIPLLGALNWTGYAMAMLFAVGLCSTSPPLHAFIALGPPLLFPITAALLAQPAPLSP
jgi:hypothetical protein